ncbi:hypothetical protein GGI14_001674 [Coemansia sp. S680]|nr:hypothetical protein GGI14_001674 [Coemansia sp. S680]
MLSSKSGTQSCVASTLCKRVRVAVAFAWLTCAGLLAAIVTVGVIGREQAKLGLDWYHVYSYDVDGTNLPRQPPPGANNDNIRGNVLEIGPGLGESLLQLSRKKLGSRYVALEPNPYLHEALAENAKKAGFGSIHYDLLTCPNAAELNTGGETPVLSIVNGTLDGMVPQYVRDHAPYDTVVSSLVLCSVDNPQATLDSILELLVPGGRFVFIEHVRHTDEMDLSVDASVYASGSFNIKAWGWMQELLTPIWSLVGGNCHLNRRTAQLLDDMKGWSSVRYTTLRLSGSMIDKLGPFIYGVATKALP